MVEDSASLLRSSTCHWRKTRHGGRTLRTIAACAPTRDVQTIVGGHQRNKISTWHKYMRTQTGYNSFMIDPRGQPKREGKHTMGAVTDESLALLGTTQQSILGPTLASPGMGFATMVPKTLGIARPPSSAHAGKTRATYNSVRVAQIASTVATALQLCPNTRWCSAPCGSMRLGPV